MRSAPVLSATVLAPAKLNLYLHITGRRPDGFHLLDSVFVFAGTGDRVTLTRAETPSFTITGRLADQLAPTDDNLVMRSLNAVAATLGRDLNFQITLNKDMPIAAGIGGGSSDAAAAVRALAAFWPEVNNLPLIDILTPLGADIPPCLTAAPVHVGGIGDILTPTPPLPPLWCVLVNTGTPVSTPEVFKAYKAQSKSFSDPGDLSQSDLKLGLDPHALATTLKAHHNDLEAPALSVDPNIQDTLAAVAATPQCLLSRVSGSGGTVFGLYASEAQAQTASKILATAFPSAWIKAAPILTTPPVVQVS